MRILFWLITLSIVILSACSSGPRSAYLQQCISTTKAMSSARVDCVQQANLIEKQDIANQQRMDQMAGFAATCDSYGFKRETTSFSQCLQQAEQQSSINASIQMQQDELSRQAQERQLRLTKCYLDRRTDCWTIK